MADHGSKLEQMDVSQQDLLQRVKALEQGSASTTASGHDGRSLVSKYACTLVFGGWARDTRRQMLLSQLDAALAFLSLDALLDERPWTTGPRRSTAMVKFRFRDGEGHQEMRQRMLKLVTTFAEADYKISGSRLWCTFSKTPEERARAGHASLVKRVVQAVAPVCLDALDLEHSSGSAWLGESKVASCSEPAADENSGRFVVLHNRGGRGWIDVEALAKETGLKVQTVRAELDRQRR